MDEEKVMDNDIVALRDNLMKAILHNVNTTQNIPPLLHLHCPLHKKYVILDIIGLIQKNSESVEQLKQIGLTMNILEMYGRHLLKEPGNRSEMWRYVKFDNPVFKDHISPLKGVQNIMHQMGYTLDIQDGLEFPENLEPDRDKLLQLLTDILLSRKELEVFLQGHHPQPDVVEVHLMQTLKNDLKHMWNKSTGTVPLQANTASQMLPLWIPFDSTSIEPSDKSSHGCEKSLQSNNEHKQKKLLSLDGKKLVAVIKNAEREGYEMDEIELALNLSKQENMSPIIWLHQKWRNMVETVITMAIHEGQKMAQNDVGQISWQEAKTALKETKGDVKAAAEHCVDKRKKQMLHLYPFNSTSIEPSDKRFHGCKTSLQSNNEHKQKKLFSLNSKKLVAVIKIAEREGYEMDEIELALNLSKQENMSPIIWLQKKWRNMVETVITMAIHEGQKMAQNDVGQISWQEAKTALKETKGDVKAAAEHCVDKRKKQFAEIVSCGNFDREDILRSLFEHKDMKASLVYLNNIVLQPYVNRLMQSEYQNLSRSQASHKGKVEVQDDNVCGRSSNSVMKNEDFQHAVRNKEIDTKRRIRMILVECKLQSWGRAETVIKILDDDFIKNAENYTECTLEDVIDAVKNCDGTRSASLVLLCQECQTCFSKYPMNKIKCLGTCSCKLCEDCFKMNFEIAIREKHVRNWTCPSCQLPDIEESEGYLTFLAMLLNNYIAPEIMELFSEKLKDWHLQRDPNFRWCAHCGNGSLWEAGEQTLAMECHQCHKKTCFKCKKQWDTHHEGLTCKQYEQWKIDNDPDNQAQGLARHLEANGIDCPKCKMRFDLARGGCMHFKCHECCHEFCSGCFNTVFKKICIRRECQFDCLHCHHPRDCLFYLRDYDVPDLKKLLRIKHVQFNETEPQDQQDQHLCPVMEQNESTKKDEPCGKVVEAGCAGLCCAHYKEYLVGIINRHKLDPVIVMSDDRLKIFMEQQNKCHSYPNDRKKLEKFIKMHYPLTKKH